MSPIYKIVDVNFHNSNHNEIIKKLSKRNKFHKADIHACCDDYEYALNKFMSLCNKNNIKINHQKQQEYIDCLQKEAYKNNPNYKGYLVCLENKPIGFILYYLRSNNCNHLNIHFLLIDKNYQRNGYGTILINHLKQAYEDFVIVVRSDNDYSNDWYIQKHFLTSEQFLSKIMKYNPNPFAESQERVVILANLMNDSLNSINQTRLYFKNNFKLT